MMGSMNKRMNTLSNRDIRESETNKHDLKKNASLGNLLRTEMQEHNLKKKPTLSQVKSAEAKEHAR